MTFLPFRPKSGFWFDLLRVLYPSCPGATQPFWPVSRTCWGEWPTRLKPGASPPTLLGQMGAPELLRYMVEVGASDLHLRAGSSPFVRVDGELEPCPYPALSAPDTEALATEL